MKTNILNLILATIAFGGIALVSATRIVANFNLMAICVSYTAVAILAALAMADYRGNVRDYAAR